MNDAVIETVRVVIVAALLFAGQRLVAKYSKQANSETVKVQDEANHIDGMDRLVQNLETRLGKVEERADKLADRVRALEEERVRDKSLIRNLWAYVVTLRTILRTLNHPIPEPPGALDFDSPLT